VPEGQAARYLLAALLLVALLPRHQRLPRGLGLRVWGRLVLLSLTGLVGFNLVLIPAASAAGPALVGAVVGAAPLVMALAAPGQIGGRPEGRVLLAAAVVVAGIVVIEAGARLSAVGLGLAAGALIGEVCFSLLAAPLLPDLGPLRVSAMACALAVPILALATVTGPDAGLSEPSASQAGVVVYLGVVVTVVGFLGWYSGLGRLGAARAGLFLGTIPSASFVMAVILRTGTFQWRATFGCLLVAAGVTIGMTRPTDPLATAGSTHRAAESLVGNHDR
jgi:drug/metabolite transporter (DMT)-like permease